jgi:hypothetical protein
MDNPHQYYKHKSGIINLNFVVVTPQTLEPLELHHLCNINKLLSFWLALNYFLKFINIFCDIGNDFDRRFL